MSIFKQQLRKVAPWLCLGLVMALLNAACDLFWPAVISSIVDKGIRAGNADHIRRTLFLMGGVAILSAVVKYSKNTCAILTGNRYCRNMRQAFFDKILSLSSSNVARFGAATLVTRCTNDITAIGSTLDAFIRVMVRIPITCLGGLVLAFAQDWRMALIILAVIPFLLVFSIWMLRTTTPIYASIQTSLDSFNRVLREKLWGVRVVRVFCRDGYEKARLDEANAEMAEKTMAVERRIAVLNPLMTLVVNLTILVLVVYAARRATLGTLQIGVLISCIMYANQILMSVVQSAMLLSRLPRTAVSVRRIEEVMQTQPSVPDTGTRSPSGNTDEIRFDHVSFRFPDAQTDTLKDLNFTIRKGQVTAIIGATGSGKTTLLHLLERFYDPSSGAVYLGDTDLRDLPQAQLRRRFSVVPQQAFLFEASIRDNLHYGCEDATDDELNLALQAAQAAEFVNAFDDGLDHAVASGGSNLSGGQRQRLSIARALLRRPDFFLLDDSFSALDLKTDAAVRKGLRQVAPDCAFVIVAQRIATIRDADQI
ncbi:MAG: ABC transporter ATP-binding protein/permease, partial [Oscillospiraceae bacterium]|nr:ABC transporter ATP-binding protein/permease [Oscillospiraceae bacterium]